MTHQIIKTALISLAPAFFAVAVVACSVIDVEHGTVSKILAPLDDSHNRAIEQCVSGQPRTHCVVDGDTVHWHGVTYRLQEIDTPEYSPHGSFCPDTELTRAILATKRLVELLNSGAVQVVTTGERGYYGRELGNFLVNGKDVGDTLVSEGLAVPYEGRRNRKAWCKL